MASRVFRQAALERLASPEQLDELVRIGDPLGWLALAAAATLMAGALAWGLYGSISSEALGKGVLVHSGRLESAGELRAVLYVPAAEGREVRPGMRACVVPEGLDSREYGCLLGEVRRVAARPGPPRQRDSLIEVEVTLARDAGMLTDAALVSGTPATGSILIRRYRPLELLLPARSGGRVL
jgi:hypothetical protein